MAKKALKHTQKRTKDKDVQELNRVIAALKGAEHNPIEWAAIIRLIAPILGRLAARYAAGWLATKWNKRATPKIRKEVAEMTADRMATALTEQLLKK